MAGKPARKSRILASLDNPALSPSAATSSSSPLAHTSLGLGPYQTPSNMHMDTSSLTQDEEAMLSIIRRGQKRKFSGPEMILDDDSDAEASGSSPPPFPPLAPRAPGQFSIRYDQESMVRSIDRGGHDQETKMAEFVSKAIDNAAHGITVQKAVDRLSLRNAHELIPGMEVYLLKHQLIGVSWMIDQERKSEYKGGILADDMGLGKTVQMIATMVINQPQVEDKHRATLIVVPAALLLQWKEELESKTTDAFEVHIQHGKDKILDPNELGEKDVVITTYQTLNLDFNIPSDLESGEELEYLKDHGGPMSRTKWYRVICDEAQFIRNRSTRCSCAVAMLRAKYRWCLTGTPITNTLADIYGYLRFGHFRPWNDWSAFNQHIAKVQLEDAPLAGMRAQGVLKPLLLRRTKDATIDGQPILELPAKQVDLIELEFSPEERELYDLFEKRAQIQINRFIRDQSLLKNAQAVLVMILRLRQLSTHPSLILQQSFGFADATALIGSDSDKELARATRVMGQKWVANIKQSFLARARALQIDMEDEAEEPMCCKCGDLFLADNGLVMACGHEICKDCREDLQLSNIEHNGEFGNNDDKTNFRIEKEFEDAAKKGHRPCPQCKKMQDLTPNRTFLATAFMPTQEEVRAAPVTKARRQVHSSPSPPPKRRKIEEIDLNELDLSSSESDSDLGDGDAMSLLLSSPAKRKNKAPAKKTLAKRAPMGKGKAPVRGRKPSAPVKSSRRALAQDSDEDMGSSSDEDMDDGEEKEPAPAREPDLNAFATWKEGGANVEPSAKMIAMIDTLKEWEVTGDKTIVFSQWTSMLDLCEQIFARHGIRSLRYDGKMGREAREYCLAQFRQPRGPKVVLVSTKCGGVGLNLVSANRVINLDLSWNYAVESQAYDRVHRLGQEKQVFVKRFVVKNTIEQRMLTLQDTKLGLAEAALGEGTGTRLNKLSVKQIKALFGMGQLNKRGESQAPGQSQ